MVQAFDRNPLDINYVSLGNLNVNDMDYYFNCRSDQLKDDLIAYADVYKSSTDSLTPTRLLHIVHCIFCSFILWARIQKFN